MGLLQLLFGFSGRINRMQYWLGSLGAGFAGGFLIFASVMTVMPAASMSKQAALTAGPLMLLVMGAIMMGLGWVGMALQWKRFHDRDRPGWCALIPILPMMMIMATVVNGALTNAPLPQVMASVNPWMMLVWAINLWFFIDLGCLAGVDGRNQYGDPPGSPRASTPAPQAPTGAPAAAAAATPMASLFGAQSAMDRAIAQHQARPHAAARPAMAAAAPAGGGPSFGRKAR